MFRWKDEQEEKRGSRRKRRRGKEMEESKEVRAGDKDWVKKKSTLASAIRRKESAIKEMSARWKQFKRERERKQSSPSV